MPRGCKDTPGYITRANTRTITGEKSEYREVFQEVKEEFVELHEVVGYGSFLKKLDEFIIEYNWIRPH